MFTFVSPVRSSALKSGSKVLTSSFFRASSTMANVHYPESVTKHLAPGSVCPEVKPGLMRLYSMVFCPYAQRTRLVLAAKKIPNEVVNVNLVTKPEWYFARNPLGKVPCLEMDGKLIFESLITADYLDEVYPSPHLLNNSDPYRKAQDRILIEMFNAVNSNLYKLYRAKIDDESTWKVPIEGIHKGLQLFEDDLTKRGIEFFGGHQYPGMVDYMIWPWMERLPSLPVLTGGVIKIEMEKFPNLMKWCEAMKEDTAVKESYITPENHAEFIRSFLAGSPAYDMDMK